MKDEELGDKVLTAIDDVIARATIDHETNSMSHVSSVTLLWLLEVRSVVKQVLRASEVTAA